MANGNPLKEAIRNSGLSARALGELADVPHNTITRFVAGERTLTLESAQKLDAALRAETPGAFPAGNAPLPQTLSPEEAVRQRTQAALAQANRAAETAERFEPKAEWIKPLILPAASLTAAYVYAEPAGSARKRPGRPPLVKPFRLGLPDGRVGPFVVTAMSEPEPGDREWLARPLYELADFRRKFPRAELRRSAGYVGANAEDFFVGLTVAAKLGGKGETLMAVGPLAEARRLVEREKRKGA